MNHRPSITRTIQTKANADRNQERLVPDRPPVQLAPPAFRLSATRYEPPVHQAVEAQPFSLSGHSPLQRSAEAPPIQMKALSTERLNVVGETHDESDEVRGGEQFVVHQETGGGYWEEFNFWVYTDEEQTDWRWGDSIFLLFKQCLGNLAQFGRNSFTLLAIYSLQEQSDERDKKMEDTAEMILAETREMLGHYGDNKEKAQEFTDLLEANLIFMDLEEYMGKIARLQALMKSASEEKIFGDEAEAEAKEILTDTVPLFLDMSTVAQERSDYMLDSANMGANVPGVWKIGNDHIPDITGSPKEKNFEVLTQKEFYDDYGEMIEANKGNEYVPEE